MTFLEARKLLAEFKGGANRPFLLAMSGTPDQLELYLRAHAARLGAAAEPRLLPFGTLAQHLFSEPDRGIDELFLLMPWDLAAECDWRSGGGSGLSEIEPILARAEKVLSLMAKRPHAHFAYLPAPLPPICAARIDTQRLAAELNALASRLGAEVIDCAAFSMPSYLASGCPIASSWLSKVAEMLIVLLLAPPPGAFKVLATDADNTLWAGIVGEDGADTVAAESHGRGFRHFIYQGMLKRLRDSGILLAVVSRNDEDMVRAPLASGRMTLEVDDFVTICSGYGRKSDLVRHIAESLNLGLESIVFVDDNPVELAEVAAILPQVTFLNFPSKDDELPIFLDCLARLFDRRQLTVEDAERTNMYRRRVVSLPPTEADGLIDFLKDMEMVMTVFDRSHGNWTRAIQLINKTNQFNLNGVRWSEAEVVELLGKGGQLFTASLEDRTGSHGEVLACLIDMSGCIQALVMSCRVLQRRLEFAFMAWLIGRRKGTVLTLAFMSTDRNLPMRNFLADSAFTLSPGASSVKSSQFVANHVEDSSLFIVREC
jgi:FkbH-like protein